MIRICLVRHGETDWNVQRRIQGQVDIELNAQGLAQAAATAHALSGHRFDAIHSSDLARARVTAQTAATTLGLPLHFTPALRERDYGGFQTLTYAEAAQRHPDTYARFESRDPHAAFPGGGESLVDFDRRVRGFLDSLRCAAPATLLLVTHGGVLDLVNRIARDHDLCRPRDFDIPNCALNWIVHDGQRWQLERWADTGHLADSLDELPH